MIAFSPFPIDAMEKGWATHSSILGYIRLPLVHGLNCQKEKKKIPAIAVDKIHCLPNAFLVRTHIKNSQEKKMGCLKQLVDCLLEDNENY